MRQEPIRRGKESIREEKQMRNGETCPECSLRGDFSSLPLRLALGIFSAGGSAGRLDILTGFREVGMAGQAIYDPKLAQPIAVYE